MHGCGRMLVAYDVYYKINSQQFYDWFYRRAITDNGIGLKNTNRPIVHQQHDSILEFRLLFCQVPFESFYVRSAFSFNLHIRIKLLTNKHQKQSQPCSNHTSNKITPTTHHYISDKTIPTPTHLSELARYPCDTNIVLIPASLYRYR